MRGNMYQNKIRFSLIIDNIKTEILEPLSLRDAQWVLKRDADYFGFTAEYIDENARLEFSNENNSGRSLIAGVYENKGGDGLIKFSMEMFINNEWKEFIVANLNLNTIEQTVEALSCSIEKTSFNSLFRTRFETVVASNAITTIDGADSEELDPITVKIQAQPIKKELLSELKKDPDNLQTFQPISFPVSGGHLFDLIPKTELSINDFDDNTSIGGAILRCEYGETNNVENYAHFVSKKQGLTTITIRDFHFSFHFRTWKTIFQTERPKTRFRVSANIRFFNSSGVPVYKYEIFNYETDNAGNTYAVSEFKGDWNLSYMRRGEPIIISRMMNVGDYFVVDVRIETDQFMSYKDIDFPPCLFGIEKIDNYNDMKLYVVQIEETQPTDCRVWKFKDVLLKNLDMIAGSKNIQSNFLSGCYENIYLSNGWNVRRVTSQPLKSSMKPLFLALSANSCLGYTLRTVDGQDQILIEPFEFFFQDKKICQLPLVFDYQESMDKDFIINEIIVGYDKFQDTDAAGQDAVNTIRTYLTPIRTHKKKLEKKCPIVADGYYIEKVRSIQYEETQPASDSDDDTLFFFCLNDDKTTSIDNHVVNLQGLIKGEKSYNLRLSPARMMNAWQKYLHVGLSFKQSGETISLQDIKGNAFASCSVNNDCKSTAVITEGQNFAVDNTKKIFTARLISFKTKIDFLTFDLIRQACLAFGENANGYVEIKSPSEWKNVYVKELKYNPITEIAEITSWKKY